MNTVAIAPVYIHSTIKRRKQTWYTIADGNWSNPNIWASNGRRRYSYPSITAPVSSISTVAALPSIFGFTSYDDVYINHNVTLDVGNTGTSATILNNLSVASGVTLSTTGARGLVIQGDLQVNGALDLSGASSIQLLLYGVNNYVNSFVAGTGSTVNYMGQRDQPIMDLAYRNLAVYGNGTRYLTNNLTVLGTLTGQWFNNSYVLIIECGSYNITINGATTFNGCVLSKTGSGSMVFIGAYVHASIATNSGISFTGNPTVEFKGGCTFSGSPVNYWDTGTSTWSFTTATQTATFSTGTFPFTAPVSIVGAITLNEAGTGIMQLNLPIDCTSASGALVCKGLIYWNATASLPSMTTGTIDRLSFANTCGYTMPASITLPYTTYWSLLTDNSGTKTALGNTSLLGNLTVGVTSASAQTGFFELATFDITIAGSTTLVHTLSKTSSGSVLFTGAINYSNALGRIDFFTGNPTVECRGGMAGINVQDNGNYGNSGGSTGAIGVVGYVSTNSHFKSGTGTWTFSTNSQTIVSVGNTGSRFIWNCPVVISGAIVLTISNFNYVGGGTANAENTSAGGFVFNSTVNGTVSGSTLRAAGFVGFNNSTAPMATGVLDTTTSANTIGYLWDGSYTLPLTSYSGLYIAGIGTKTLAGNTTLTGALFLGSIKTSNILTDANTLECNAYNLSVAGATQTGDVNGSKSTISKTGSGSITFTGLVSLNNDNPAPFNFSGNPTVEFKGGLTWVNGANMTGINCGTGLWSFTTNNQNLQGFNTAITITAPVLISGAITVTNVASSPVTFTGTVDGNNAASTLDNRGTLNYQNTTRPMVTGVLQTNAAANTFLYNKAGNQDVTGGASTGAKQIYRTLTLAGSGIKLLQGYVSVINTYTLTAPATKSDNGFTLTNP